MTAAVIPFPTRPQHEPEEDWLPFDPVTEAERCPSHDRTRVAEAGLRLIHRGGYGPRERRFMLTYVARLVELARADLDGGPPAA